MIPGVTRIKHYFYREIGREIERKKERKKERKGTILLIIICTFIPILIASSVEYFVLIGISMSPFISETSC